jgi:hypothetical protein
VLLDVMQGKVSQEAARDHYGVVIEFGRDEPSVNIQASVEVRAKLRAARKAKRPMIDRGFEGDVA